MIKIYVLKLEFGKFYIGQSINFENRLKAHIKGKLSSEWTKKYKPIEEVEIIETNFTNISDAMFLENSITLKYMKEFGWKNVRGGDFVTINEDKLRFLLCNNSDLSNEILPILNPKNYNLNTHGIFIFTLKLNMEKYYVGKTKNLKIGILKEFNGKGSKWCDLYKPTELLSVINVKKQTEEEQKRSLNNQVISMMKNTNWWKVRGGDYYKTEEDNHKKKVMHNTDIKT